MQEDEWLWRLLSIAINHPSLKLLMCHEIARMVTDANGMYGATMMIMTTMMIQHLWRYLKAMQLRPCNLCTSISIPVWFAVEDPGLFKNWKCRKVMILMAKHGSINIWKGTEKWQHTKPIFKQCVLVHKVHAQIRQVTLINTSICLISSLEAQLTNMFGCLLKSHRLNLHRRLLGIYKANLFIKG